MSVLERSSLLAAVTTGHLGMVANTTGCVWFRCPAVRVKSVFWANSAVLISLAAGIRLGWETAACGDVLLWTLQPKIKRLRTVPVRQPAAVSMRFHRSLHREWVGGVLPTPD